ncbi:MAG: cyclic nucleotide-binding domain-containing protein [Myxococcota bacterium]
MSGTTVTPYLLGLHLFEGVDPESMSALGTRFQRVRLEEQTCLFERGQAANELYVLVDGQIDLLEGEKVRASIRPVSPLGEMGALTAGLKRNTTARAVSACELWKISRSDLLSYIDVEPEAGARMLHNLLGIISDKVTRDGMRMEQMRHNLIRTQKAMKMLRDEVLSQPETQLSDAFHDTLEALISHNRRVNYALAPPAAMPVVVRSEGREEKRILRISRTRLVVETEQSAEVGLPWSGVLSASNLEIPVSGSVAHTGEGTMEVELDLLMAEYADAFEDYLTQAQLLDLVV